MHLIVLCYIVRTNHLQEYTFKCCLLHRVFGEVGVTRQSMKEIGQRYPVLLSYWNFESSCDIFRWTGAGYVRHDLLRFEDIFPRVA